MRVPPSPPYAQKADKSSSPPFFFSCRAAVAAYNGGMKVSRRKLMQVMLPAAAASVPLGSEMAAQTPANTDSELENARQYLRVGAQVVRQVALPMSAEPATRFIPRS